jgi:hypothetical protein
MDDKAEGGREGGREGRRVSGLKAAKEERG